MNDLLKKLNYTGQDPVLVLNAPTEFAPTMKELGKGATVVEAPRKVKTCGFAIIFATKQREVDASIKAIASKLEGDEVLWFAYPKATSKNYTCEFNRDTGWAELGKAGFEGVGPWPSMRTGQPCDSVVWPSSRR